MQIGLDWAEVINLGILDRFKGKKSKKETVEGIKYILVRKGAKGGYEKVLDLPELKTPDELYQALSPGTYCIHIYKKGQSGFESTEAFTVEGDSDTQEVAPQQPQTPFSALRTQLEGMATLQKEMLEIGELFATLSGTKKSTTVELMETVKALKAEKDLLNELFPGATTASNEIPIEGKIPAWMAALPGITETMMGTIEKSLNKWGLTGSSGSGNGAIKPGVVQLPTKPQVLRDEKMRSLAPAIDKKIGLNIPKKPQAQLPVAKPEEPKPEPVIQLAEDDPANTTQVQVPKSEATPVTDQAFAEIPQGAETEPGANAEQ